ncbi:uncharacterized protein EAF01_001510 [Botrytis porri]|uniref:Uncharacterized protein n=1 Tax=Botrytis porri TaxID=87229 RepID=A0A4Z1KJA6_9HELO|nr:uncharacterized protein EAF01_001510 [Botrytis porri]KAF7912489.1 hypothetical protein EAF01_001510 [Botrytis porri]TGO84342.1 hypothetical protein BPOR_0517g00090 [Botrytis porri]
MSKSPIDKRAVVVSVSRVAILFALIFLVVFIATDIIHIPYLSHGLDLLFSWMTVILSPVYPFWAPLTLGVSIKLYRHKAFPKQREWITSSILIFISHLGRVIVDTMQPLGFFDKVCSLRNCWHEYIQMCLIAVVIIGEVVGIPWDANVVQSWVNILAVESEDRAAKETAINDEDGMEKGLVDQAAEEVTYLDSGDLGLHEKQMSVETFELHETEAAELPMDEALTQSDEGTK